MSSEQNKFNLIKIRFSINFLNRSVENGHETSSQPDIMPKESQETDQSLRVTSTPFLDASQKKPGDFGSLQLSGESSISLQTSYLHPCSKTELQNSPPPVFGKFQLTSSSSSDDDRQKKEATAATKTPEPPIPESLQVPDWCQQVGEASEQSIADSESNVCAVKPQGASDVDIKQDCVMQSPFRDHHSEEKDSLSEEISMETVDQARSEKNDSEVSVTQQSELIMTGTAVDIFNPEFEHSSCKEKEKREEYLAESQPEMLFEMSQDFSQQQVRIGNYMIKVRNEIARLKSCNFVLVSLLLSFHIFSTTFSGSDYWL